MEEGARVEDSLSEGKDEGGKERERKEDDGETEVCEDPAFYQSVISGVVAELGFLQAGERGNGLELLPESPPQPSVTA
eukprot:2058745-Rhodomonas_salina.1